MHLCWMVANLQFEAFSAPMKDKPFFFSKIWELHLKFIGTDWDRLISRLRDPNWIWKIQTSIQWIDDKKLPSLL